MELRQVYEQLQGDYHSAIKRLMSEKFMKKYLKKFIDNKMDEAIMRALDAKDYETAFREAHNLKGVCANLNLDRLKVSASELTEALRSGQPQGDITELINSLNADYNMTVEALSNIEFS